jgi:hypothetical protein
MQLQAVSLFSLSLVSSLTFAALFSSLAGTLAIAESLDQGPTTSQASEPGKVLTGGAHNSQSLQSSVKLYQPEPALSRPSTARTLPQRMRVIYIPNAAVIPFARVNNPLVRAATALPRSAPTGTETGQSPTSETSSAASGFINSAPGHESLTVPYANSVQKTAELAKRPSMIHPEIPQLRSTPQLLTELLAPKPKQNLNWDDWYKRVCRVIYDQWLLDDTCAGKTTVHVTVWSSLDLECKIVDFSPAQGAIRDGAKESSFRKAALKAVNCLQRCAVLEFPVHCVQNKIDFDLDMSRGVYESDGCRVVRSSHQ